MATRLVVFFGAVLIVTLLHWLTETGRRTEEGHSSPVRGSMPKEVADWRAASSEVFASDEACAECHPAEYAAHLRSGHSQTATWMAETPLAEQLDGTVYSDLRRDQHFAFSIVDDGFNVKATGTDPSPAFPVSWLLGSGKHAQTPVAIDPVSHVGVEFRWSVVSGNDGLCVTPDHDRFDDYRPRTLETFGRPLSSDQALACVNCHMTLVPPKTVPAVREAFLPNVGCERCHSPRKDHVELARLGRAHEAKPLLTYDDAEFYIDNCAQCHRDESNVPAGLPTEKLARFQPYGLKKSQCFIESKGTLTCSNCHDPHDRTSTDTQLYVSACNSCHGSSNQVHCLVESPAAEIGESCIECHMPKVEWQYGIGFHDHSIPRFRDGISSGADAGEVASSPSQHGEGP